MLEIDGSEGQRCGLRDGRSEEQLAFPGLRGGMIHFENADGAGERAAVGVGIETRAEDHDLAHIARDGGADRILGETGAKGDEEAHSEAGGVLGGFTNDGVGVCSEDGEGQRIREDAALFQDLMRGSMGSGGPGGPAWLCGIH